MILNKEQLSAAVTPALQELDSLVEAQSNHEQQGNTGSTSMVYDDSGRFVVGSSSDHNQDTMVTSCDDGHMESDHGDELSTQDENADLQQYCQTLVTM